MRRCRQPNDVCCFSAVVLALVFAACKRSPAEQFGGEGSAVRQLAPGGWVKRLGDTNPQSVNAVAIEPDGSVIAAGYGCGRVTGLTYVNGTIDFGAGPRELVGECGLFVVKYSAAGALLWVYTEGEESARTEANALALLPANHVLVAGRHGLDMVIDELGPDGRLVASHRFKDPTGGDGNAIANSIAVAGNGDWFVGGEAGRRIDLGTGPLFHLGSAAFVARYAPDGTARWVKFPTVDSLYRARTAAVAAMPNGNVAACGTTDGPKGGDTGGGFVQALDGTTGEVRWSKVAGGECDVLASFGDILVVDGAIVAGGASLVGLTMDGASAWTMPLTSEGLDVRALSAASGTLFAAGVQRDDAVRLLAVDAKGKLLASSTYAAELTVRGLAVADNTIVIGGQLKGRADFGIGAPVTPEQVSPEAMTNFDALVGHLTGPLGHASTPPTPLSHRP